MLQLAQAVPVAKGGYQTIYRHPHDGALLIKVLNADLLQAWRRRGALARIFRGAGAYRHVIEEVSEQIFASAADGTRHDFLNPVVGLVHTDLGPGLVTPAVRDPDGNLAPSLKTLARAGLLAADVQDALEVFENRMLESAVVINDLNGGNIVYGSTDGGAPRLILIDGFGEKTLVPLGRMVPLLNRLSKRRKLRGLRARLGVLQSRAIASAQRRTPGDPDGRSDPDASAKSRGMS